MGRKGLPSSGGSGVKTPGRGARSCRRRVACYAAMPFHRRALEPIAAGFKESLVTADISEIEAWHPDVLVVADGPPIPLLRQYCDSHNVLLVGLQHGSATRYTAPEPEYRLVDYFCGSDWDIRRFVGNGAAPRKGTLLTGNPWVDEVFTVPRRELCKDAPTILFAPTYNPEITAARFFEGKLVDLVRSVYPDSRIIIKPHPAILEYDHPYVTQYRPLFQTWVEDWRRMAERYPKVEFIEDPAAAISKYFPDADILISDGSSLIFEFMALNQPILLYTSQEKIGIWEYDPEALGNCWRDVGAEFSTEEEFTAALKDAFSTHATVHSARQREHTEELYGGFQDGRSAERVIQAIRDLPCLDVLVVTKNCEGFAGDFIANLRNILANCRIHIADSGSTDGTLDIIRKLDVQSVAAYDEPAARSAILNSFFKKSAAQHILVIDCSSDRALQYANFVSDSLQLMAEDTALAAAGRVRRVHSAAEINEYVESNYCIFDREKILEVGGFSDSDADLSARIASRGYKIRSAWDERPVVRLGRGFHPEDCGVRWMSDEAVMVVGRSVFDKSTYPAIQVSFDLTCAKASYYKSFPFDLKVFQGDDLAAEVRFEQPHQTVAVELPPSRSLQEIRLVSEESYVPRELGINADPRRLSVVFRNLQVRELIEEGAASVSQPEAILSTEDHDKPARLIAFYLPQFHAIPENDEWWGKGFTDWTNVKKARPLFEGHYQPHVPGELGYYDLLSPEVRKAQADLAGSYGIEGFCYWHYWFNGKRFLERPFEAVLESAAADFPVCLAWANENWTKAWDGHEDHILQAQEYGGEADDAAHFQWLLRAFSDRRYIRVDGKPLFLIYRPADMPDVSATISLWRRLAESAGLPGLYLVAIKISDDRSASGYWIEKGFDDELIFQPSFGRLWDSYGGGDIEGTVNESGGQEPGLILDYRDAWPVMAGVCEEDDCLRMVVPCWDNTPRRRHGAFILKDSLPEAYEEWLRREIQRAAGRESDRRLVFINAWNEWGEGNHLEPDEKFGRGYLVATRRALLSEAVSLLHSSGRTDEAISHLERYMALDQGYAQGHNDLGVLYCEAGDIEKARAHLEKALSLAEHDNTSRKNLADLYLALGKTDDALELYQKVLERNPDDVEILMRLGDICRESQRLSDALMFYCKALKVEPENEEAKKHIEALGRVTERLISIRPIVAASYAGPAEQEAPVDLRRGGKLRIIAILAAFNEGDIIYHVVRDLVEQDIEVYILDHHSTDNTAEEASKWLGKGLLKIEKFPDESGIEIPNNVFSLRYILLRKEQLVRELGPAWYINADVDEFRESPWPGLNLRQGIERVDAQGYNTINFAILDFKPTDNSFVPGEDVRKRLTHHAESKVAWDHMQARCWKHWGQPLELWQTGGHLIFFEGRRIYPIPFILRHYPIRSQQHGELKIFNERKNRFDKAERAAKWHVQYDEIAQEEHNFLHDKKELTEYNGFTVCRSIFRRYGGVEIGKNAHEELTGGAEFKTSIAILAHNQLEYTQKCLESIRRHTDAPYELVIVDNGSTDGTPEYLAKFKASWEKERKALSDPESDCCKAVKVIRHDRNLGFAGGNNSGIAASEGAYVCLMNNDIVVTPGWLGRLTRFAEWDPRIGIVGPISNNVSGPQRAPSVSYDQGSLEGLDEFAERWAQSHKGTSQALLRLVGFCMLIKRNVIERIGGLDTRFGLGNFEDDDFSIRAAIAGFRSAIAVDCFVHHFGSRTFAGERIDYRKAFLKNWAVFKEKWGLPADLPHDVSYNMSKLARQSFYPERHYCPLPADSRKEPVQDGKRWFAAPQWKEVATWRPIVERYVCSQAPDGESLLQLYAGHRTGSDSQEAYRQVAEFLQKLGVDSEKCPDIEVTAKLPEAQTVRIILTGGLLDNELQLRFPGRCVHLDEWRRAA